MQDSGIVCDIKSFTNGNEDGNFYELKSKVVRGSPVREIKHVSSTTRTGLKMQLMKLQSEIQNRPSSSQRSAAPNPSQIVNIPVTTPSNVSFDVASQFFQNSVRLENPTKYHIEESQKRQMQLLLRDKGMVQSLPTMNVSSVSAQPQSMTQCGSAPADPDSPLSIGRESLTSNNEIELLGDFISMDSMNTSMDSDLYLIEPTLKQISSTVPHNSGLFEPFSPTDTSSQSCPSEMFIKQEYSGQDYLVDGKTHVLAKERQKKDKHNDVEKRRRFYINDRITELGTLLPKTIDLDLKRNKGTILKASVEYIRSLKKDSVNAQVLSDQLRKTEMANRNLQLRIQQLEQVMKSSGIVTMTQDTQPFLRTINPNSVFIDNPAPSTVAPSVAGSRAPQSMTIDEETMLFLQNQYLQDESMDISDPVLTAVTPDYGLDNLQ